MVGRFRLFFRREKNVSHNESAAVKWEVIGTAYAHGFMDGLASQWATVGKLTKRDFDLI